ncbi:MAG: hypothetical protein Q9217_004461 [Psora testacea]
MADRSTTPPPLRGQAQVHGPTAKERKYDRQLRLWAASGQVALEQAKILLLNSGPGVVGIETLKNLILPGVGSFTIVDEAVVEEKDLGVNFFLTKDSLGLRRAEESCRLLKELNPEVEGHFIQSSITSFILDLEQLKQYTLTLLIGPSPHVHTISAYAAANSIPLFYVHSLGFYSHFSLQLPSQFPIIDTHPDPASTQDLRLLNPWPELVEYTRHMTAQIDTLSDHEHGHIPYLLILLYYLEEWKSSHNGRPPANYDEKKELKALVSSGARTSNPEGGEENFDEAAAAVLKSLNLPTISSGLREVFDCQDCKAPYTTSPNFWLIAHAISAFHSEHGALPLPGALPDMKAQSADYIHLQNIYKRKAREDLAEVTSTVRRSEKALQRRQLIDDTEIQAFCKNAAFVKCIRGKSLAFAQLAGGKQEPAEINWRSDRASALAMAFHMPEDSLLPVYLAFLAYDYYHLQRPQLDSDGDCMAIASPATGRALAAIAVAGGLEDVDRSGLQQKIDDVLREFDRANGAELHNISALTGGMVAQEVIKVVTKQYVPVDNACVFDGIASKTAIFIM